MLWIAALLGALGLTVTWVVLLGHAMSAAPRRPGAATLLALASLPAMSLLFGVPPWLAQWVAGAGALHQILSVTLLLPALANMVVLAHEAWAGRARPEPRMERLVFQPDGSPPALHLAICRAAANGEVGDPEATAMLTEDDLRQSWIHGPGAGGYYAIGLSWGERTLQRLAGETWGLHCQIYLDGELLVTPVVHGQVGATLEITGLFSRERAIAIASGVVGSRKP